MKKIIIASILVFCATTSLFADDTGNPIAIGPFINLKAGTNAGTIPTGEKTSFTFNGIPDFGVTGYLPFSKGSNVGVSLDLGYSTYAIPIQPNTGATDDNSFVSKVSYFTIAPSLNASVFTLGFAFGLPMSSNTENTSGSINMSNGTDSLAAIFEIRLGAMVPLVTSQMGRLDLNVQAGYMLTGMSSSSSTTDNPHAVSIALGLNYLFSLDKGQ